MNISYFYLFTLIIFFQNASAQQKPLGDLHYRERAEKILNISSHSFPSRFSASRTNNLYKLDTLKRYRIPNVDTLLYSYSVYTYDRKNRVLTDSSFQIEWDFADTTLSNLSTYQYFDDQNAYEETWYRKSFSDGSLEPYLYLFYIFDDQGKLIDERYRYEEEEYYLQRTVYSYDSLEQLDNLTDYYRESIDDSWQIDRTSELSFTKDSLNRITRSIYKEFYFDEEDSLTYIYMNEFYYDGDRLDEVVISDNEEDEDTLGEEVKPFAIERYTYDDEGNIVRYDEYEINDDYEYLYRSNQTVFDIDIPKQKVVLPLQALGDVAFLPFPFFTDFYSMPLFTSETDEEQGQTINILEYIYSFTSSNQDVMDAERMSYPLFSIKKNPSHSRIEIDLNSALESGFSYQIITMDGKTLLTEDLRREWIDTSTLSNGQFILQITSRDGRSYSQSFVKI